MHITRIQYPIGQGCFHAGSIRPPETAKDDAQAFHYVYDCGSDDQEALGEAIDNYKTITSRVDALFVSHLDRDHVNGIDGLLSAVNVDTVYVPYANEEVLVLELIQAELEGNLSASLVQASLEPNKWFGNRGVGSVIRVRSSPSDGVPIPDNNDNRDESDRAENTINTGLSGRNRKIKVVESGHQLKLPGHFRSLNWTLVPHVDPTPGINRNKFRRKVRSIIGLTGRHSLTSARLLDAMRDRKKRELLRECYNEIVPHGAKHMHNRISMSLYSGPASSEEQFEWSCRCLCRPNWDMDTLVESTPELLWSFIGGAVGWIGTGDATLKVKKVRTAWQGTYDRYRYFVVTLLLPHHGSKHNFHPDVLAYPNLVLCAASAGKPSRYRHPSSSVLLDVSAQKKAFCHVSQFPETMLCEEIRPR